MISFISTQCLDPQQLGLNASQTPFAEIDGDSVPLAATTNSTESMIEHNMVERLRYLITILPQRRPVLDENFSPPVQSPTHSAVTVISPTRRPANRALTTFASGER
jgi:hypothetical protein